MWAALTFSEAAAPAGVVWGAEGAGDESLALDPAAALGWRRKPFLPVAEEDELTPAERPGLGRPPALHGSIIYRKVLWQLC